jgi:DNA (cytosine-5)-methyltransferase 1
LLLKLSIVIFLVKCRDDASERNASTFWSPASNNMSENRVRAIDLFSGAGGSSWGAHSAGVEIVAAFDAWSTAGDTHSANFPSAKFFLGRLEDVNLDSVTKELGKIDLILASPECTSHSPARGNRPHSEESKDTAFQVIRFARKLQPRWIVVENVVSMRRWNRYAKFKKAIESLGYNLREQILDASHFGVPQTRRRLFILADLQAIPPVISPREFKGAKACTILNLNGAYKWSPLRTKRRATATLRRADRAIKAIGGNKPFLLVYYGSDHAGGWQKLDRPLRTITTLDRFSVVKPSKGGHVMRMLQVPELQAAMGMPKAMKFKAGTRRDQIKMIGNAVCPPVMRSVLRQLINDRCGSKNLSAS